MLARDFCFWAQGFFEVAEAGGGGKTLNEHQVRLFKAHLALVFKHDIDPSMQEPPAKSKHQQELDAVHESGKPGKKPKPPTPASISIPHHDGPFGPILRC